jgi:hypothetical protein
LRQYDQAPPALASHPAGQCRVGKNADKQPVSKATREAEFTKLLTVMVSNQQIGGWDLAFLKEFGAFPSHPSFISSFENKKLQ